MYCYALFSNYAPSSAHFQKKSHTLQIPLLQELRVSFLTLSTLKSSLKVSWYYVLRMMRKKLSDRERGFLPLSSGKRGAYNLYRLPYLELQQRRCPGPGVMATAGLAVSRRHSQAQTKCISVVTMQSLTLFSGQNLNLWKEAKGVMTKVGFFFFFNLLSNSQEIK